MLFLLRDGYPVRYFILTSRSTEVQVWWTCNSVNNLLFCFTCLRHCLAPLFVALLSQCCLKKHGSSIMTAIPYAWMYVRVKTYTYPAQRSAGAWWARAPWSPPEASSWSWSPHWEAAAATWTACLRTAPAHGCTHRIDKPVTDTKYDPMLRCSVRGFMFNWTSPCLVFS